MFFDSVHPPLDSSYLKFFGCILNPSPKMTTPKYIILDLKKLHLSRFTNRLSYRVFQILIGDALYDRWHSY